MRSNRALEIAVAISLVVGAVLIVASPHHAANHMQPRCVWNIPTACNRATADFMISSPLMGSKYDRLVPDYDEYRRRRIASATSAD